MNSMKSSYLDICYSVFDRIGLYVPADGNPLI